MILDTVQSKILLILERVKKEETLRFCDIQTQEEFKGKKHGNKMTLWRALNELEENSWIIKYGKGTRKPSYGLNWKKKDIAEIVTKTKFMPNPNDKFYPVGIDTNALASELYENGDDMEVEHILPHLEIVIAGEKIDGFEKSVKGLEKNYKLLAETARFMNFIVMGMTNQNTINYRAQMQKEGKDVNTEEASKEIFFKGLGKPLKKFELIISWAPERYGYLASCPIGSNLERMQRAYLQRMEDASTHTEHQKRSRKKKKSNQV